MGETSRILQVVFLRWNWENSWNLFKRRPLDCVCNCEWTKNTIFQVLNNLLSGKNVYKYFKWVLFADGFFLPNVTVYDRQPICKYMMLKTSGHIFCDRNNLQFITISSYNIPQFNRRKMRRNELKENEERKPIKFKMTRVEKWGLHVVEDCIYIHEYYAVNWTIFKSIDLLKCGGEKVPS